MIMSNKVARRKLALHSETIRTLSGADLDDIYGGTLSIAIQATIRVCRYSATIIRAGGAVVATVKWATENAPKGDPDNPPSVVTATA
jgi:hypothetical protein